VLSRLVMLGFGLYGAIRVHDLVSRRAWRRFVAILPIMDRRAGDPPNLAMPVAALYVTRVWSDSASRGRRGAVVIASSRSLSASCSR